MLPPTLISTYRKYKHDTYILATWLGNTSESLGYSPVVTGANNPPAKSGRPKGKARKQAKLQAAPPVSIVSGGTPHKSEHVLKTQDFVPMAQHIATAAAAPFEIPSFVSNALERVIFARKSVARKLSSPRSKKADATHSFFVDILEKVQEILKPLLNSCGLNVSGLETSLPSLNGQQKKAARSSANIFDLLDVYEPSESFLNAPDVVYPKSNDPRSNDNKYTVEAEDSIEDAIFALVSLFVDLFSLRDEVEDLWAKYAADELDLAAVSVATNTAIELARSMEEEITPLLDKFGGAQLLRQTCFLSICDTLGHNWQAKQNANDDFNYSAYEIGKDFFFNVQFFAGGFVQGNQPKSLPQYNGAYGWYNDDPGYQPTSNKQRWIQDKTALAEMMADLSYFAEFFQQPVEDELIRGLKLIREERLSIGNIPIWFNFATQMYLQILEIERKRGVGRSFAEMQSTSLFIKKSLSRVPSSSKERRQALRMATMWESDPITQCRQMLYAEGLQKPLPAQYKRPLFNFLRRNPVYCGLWVHFMRTEFHRQGVLYSAVPGALMCVGQLNHALRQEKLLPTELIWDDIENLRKMQGDDAFFIGNPPNSPAEYFKNFCMTIGMSITNWASNKRDKKLKTTQATRREMHYKGWASMTIRERFNSYRDRRAMSSEVVNEIIKIGRQSQKHHGQQAEQVESQPPADVAAPKATPSELLQQLAKSVQAEIPDITFDYFAMHTVCWELLKALRKRFEQHYGADKIATYIPQEDKLPHLVGYIFSTAAGALDIKRTTEPNMTMMIEAAEEVTALLSSGRGHCIRDASAAPLDVDEPVELDFGGLNTDPWNLGSGKLIDFLTKGMENGACPMQ